MEKLTKSLATLLKPDDSSAEEVARACRVVTELLLTATVQSYSEYAQTVQMAMTGLLWVADHSQPEVRLIADESMNRLIKASGRTVQNYIVLELIRNVEKNSSRTVCAALSKLAVLAPTLRQTKCRNYLLASIKFVRVLFRRNDEAVLNAVVQYLTDAGPYLLRYANETEARLFIKSLIGSMFQEDMTKKRCAAKAVVAVCRNVQSSALFFNFALQQALAEVLPLSTSDSDTLSVNANEDRCWSVFVICREVISSFSCGNDSDQLLPTCAQLSPFTIAQLTWFSTLYLQLWPQLSTLLRTNLLEAIGALSLLFRSLHENSAGSLPCLSTLRAVMLQLHLSNHRLISKSPFSESRPRIGSSVSQDSGKKELEADGGAAYGILASDDDDDDDLSEESININDLLDDADEPIKSSAVLAATGNDKPPSEQDSYPELAPPSETGSIQSLTIGDSESIDVVVGEGDLEAVSDLDDEGKRPGELAGDDEFADESEPPVETVGLDEEGNETTTTESTGDRFDVDAHEEFVANVWKALLDSIGSSDDSLLVRLARVLTATCLMSKQPKSFIPTRNVRVSWQSLALNSVSSILRCHPELWCQPVLASCNSDSPCLMMDLASLVDYAEDPSILANLSLLLCNLLSGSYAGFIGNAIEKSQFQDVATLVCQLMLRLMQQTNNAQVHRKCIQALCGHPINILLATDLNYAPLKLLLREIWSSIRRTSYWLLKRSAVSFLSAIDWSNVVHLEQSSPDEHFRPVEELLSLLCGFVQCDDARIRREAALTFAALATTIGHLFDMEHFSTVYTNTTIQRRVSILLPPTELDNVHPDFYQFAGLRRPYHITLNASNNDALDVSTLEALSLASSCLFEMLLKYGCSTDPVGERSAGLIGAIYSLNILTDKYSMYSFYPIFDGAGDEGLLSLCSDLLNSEPVICTDFAAHGALLRLTSKLVVSGMLNCLECSKQAQPRCPAPIVLQELLAHHLQHLLKLICMLSYVFEERNAPHLLANTAKTSYSISSASSDAAARSQLQAANTSTERSTPAGVVQSLPVFKPFQAISNAVSSSSKKDGGTATATPAANNTGRTPTSKPGTVAGGSGSDGVTKKSKIGPSFAQHHLLMNVFLQLKKAHSVYKVTLDASTFAATGSAADGKVGRLIQFLRDVLSSLSILTEVVSIHEVCAYAEELTQFLTSLFPFAPYAVLNTGIGLLRSIFGTNLVSCHDDFALKELHRRSELQQDCLCAASSGADGSDLFQTLFDGPISDVTMSFAKCAAHSKEPSQNVARPIRESLERRQRALIHLPESRVSKSAVSHYISLFEKLVVTALRHYFHTSDARIQEVTLSLLSELLHLRVKYRLLDQGGQFLQFILKQFELIEEGQIAQSKQLVSAIFDFLIMLSHEVSSNESKPLINGPAVLQIADGLIACEQNETCVIPAFRCLVRDAFIYRNQSTSDTATWRDLILKRLKRFIGVTGSSSWPAADLLDMLCIVLQFYSYDDKTRWKQESDELASQVLDCLHRNSLRLTSACDLDALLRFFDSVAFTVFRPPTDLLHILLLPPDQQLQATAGSWSLEFTTKLLLFSVFLAPLRPDQVLNRAILLLVICRIVFSTVYEDSLMTQLSLMTVDKQAGIAASVVGANFVLLLRQLVDTLTDLSSECLPSSNGSTLGCSLTLGQLLDVRQIACRYLAMICFLVQCDRYPIISGTIKTALCDERSHGVRVVDYLWDKLISQLIYVEPLLSLHFSHLLCSVGLGQEKLCALLSAPVCVTNFGWYNDCLRNAFFCLLAFTLTPKKVARALETNAQNVLSLYLPLVFDNYSSLAVQELVSLTETSPWTAAKFLQAVSKWWPTLFPDSSSCVRRQTTLDILCRVDLSQYVQLTHLLVNNFLLDQLYISLSNRANAKLRDLLDNFIAGQIPTCQDQRCFSETEIEALETSVARVSQHLASLIEHVRISVFGAKSSSSSRDGSVSPNRPIAIEPISAVQYVSSVLDSASDGNTSPDRYDYLDLANVLVEGLSCYAQSSGAGHVDLFDGNLLNMAKYFQWRQSAPYIRLLSACLYCTNDNHVVWSFLEQSLAGVTELCMSDDGQQPTLDTIKDLVHCWNSYCVRSLSARQLHWPLVRSLVTLLDRLYAFLVSSVVTLLAEICRQSKDRLVVNRFTECAALRLICDLLLPPAKPSIADSHIQKMVKYLQCAVHFLPETIQETEVTNNEEAAIVLSHIVELICVSEASGFNDPFANRKGFGQHYAGLLRLLALRLCSTPQMFDACRFPPNPLLSGAGDYHQRTLSTGSAFALAPAIQLEDLLASKTFLSTLARINAVSWCSRMQFEKNWNDLLTLLTESLSSPDAQPESSFSESVFLSRKILEALGQLLWPALEARQPIIRLDCDHCNFSYVYRTLSQPTMVDSCSSANCRELSWAHQVHKENACFQLINHLRQFDLSKELSKLKMDQIKTNELSEFASTVVSGGAKTSTFSSLLSSPLKRARESIRSSSSSSSLSQKGKTADGVTKSHNRSPAVSGAIDRESRRRLAGSGGGGGSGGSAGSVPKDLVDIVSTVETFRGLFDHWFSNNMCVSTVFLHDALRFLLLLSEMFTQIDQYDWLLHKLIVFSQMHPIEDDLCLFYVTIGMAKSASVLCFESGPQIIERVSRMIESCLQNSASLCQAAGLTGCLYLLQTLSTAASLAPDTVFLKQLSDKLKSCLYQPLIDFLHRRIFNKLHPFAAEDSAKSNAGASSLPENFTWQLLPVQLSHMALANLFDCYIWFPEATCAAIPLERLLQTLLSSGFQGSAWKRMHKSFFAQNNVSDVLKSAVLFGVERLLFAGLILPTNPILQRFFGEHMLSASSKYGTTVMRLFICAMYATTLSDGEHDVPTRRFIGSLMTISWSQVVARPESETTAGAEVDAAGTLEHFSLMLDRLAVTDRAECELLVAVMPYVIIDTCNLATAVMKCMHKFQTAHPPLLVYYGRLLVSLFDVLLEDSANRPFVLRHALPSVKNFAHRKPNNLSIWCLTCLFVACSIGPVDDDEPSASPYLRREPLVEPSKPVALKPFLPLLLSAYNSVEHGLTWSAARTRPNLISVELLGWLFVESGARFYREIRKLDTRDGDACLSDLESICRLKNAENRTLDSQAQSSLSQLFNQLVVSCKST